MKIEMGESLFYSWLRHVKACQIVQTNWKVSPQWAFSNNVEIETMFNEIANHFSSTDGFDVFKKNASCDQLIRQGECDALGLHMQDGITSYYAVDVAFHEDGLNYGKGAKATAYKVIEKCVRTAFCLYGFFDTKCAEIIFASPEVKPAMLKRIEPLMVYINNYFKAKGFNFSFSLIANEDFSIEVLQSVLLIGKNVADTNELFLRSYSLLEIFLEMKAKSKINPAATNAVPITQAAVANLCASKKVGEIARNVLRNILESGKVTPAEIADMQTTTYSKAVFGQSSYPVLVAS